MVTHYIYVVACPLTPSAVDKLLITLGSPQSPPRTHLIVLVGFYVYVRESQSQ